MMPRVSVKVRLLYLDGCPHWQVVMARVRAAADRVGVSVDVESVRVDTEDDARRLAFAGSPTVLVHGRDPFATAGASIALGYRLYATSEGPRRGPDGGPARRGAGSRLTNPEAPVHPRRRGMCPPAGLSHGPAMRQSDPAQFGPE